MKYNFPYPVTVRILNGYIEVSAPDFGIIKATKTLDDLKSKRDIGDLVIDVINSCNQEIAEHRSKGKALPTPSKPRGVMEHPNDFREVLLSMKEVEELLKVSCETVRRLCKSGALNYIKTTGGHRRFRLKEVEAFLQTRKIGLAKHRHR